MVNPFLVVVRAAPGGALLRGPRFPGHSNCRPRKLI